jgi:hypothetical protein
MNSSAANLPYGTTHALQDMQPDWATGCGDVTHVRSSYSIRATEQMAPALQRLSQYRTSCWSG